MDHMPLAQVSSVAAIQNGPSLVLHVVGTATGFDGTLQIVKDDTRIYPPAFSVFEWPGNCGITGQCPQRTVASAAAFEGRFRKIQVRTAGGILHPDVVFVVPPTGPTIKPVAAAGSQAPGDELAPGEWHAWQNLMSGARTLHVKGRVVLPTPAHTARLVEAHPQGINPRILLLELEVTAADGPHTEPIAVKEVTFEKKAEGLYEGVHVKGVSGTIPVEYVS